MLTIVKVLKLGAKSARVLLDNSQKVKVPLDCLSLGVLSEDDIRTITVGDKQDYVHYSFYKEPRVSKEPVCLRNMEQFDASHEIALLRGIVVKNLFVFGRTQVSPDELDDLTEECFLHFWEKKLFQRYDDRKLSNYVSYLSRAVRNYFIDIKRSSRYKTESKQTSLNQQIKGTENSTLMDFVADDHNYEDISVRQLLLDKYPEMLKQFEVVVDKLDSEETTGLSFNYKAIFKALFDGTYDQFVLTTGYSKSTVDSRKKFLIDMLYPPYKEFMYA